MWSKEIIQEKLKEDLLPCARCHNWKNKDNFKQNLKVCEECIKKQVDSKKMVHQQEPKKPDCFIS